MKTIIYTIPGMRSPFGQSHILAAVSRLAGVRVERIEPGMLTANMPLRTSPLTVSGAIEAAGYLVDSLEETAHMRCTEAFCMH